MNRDIYFMAVGITATLLVWFMFDWMDCGKMTLTLYTSFGRK